MILSRQIAYSKQTGRNITVHYWDGQNIVLETNTNNFAKAVYLRSSSLVSQTIGVNAYFYLHNAHGDVVQRVMQNGDSTPTYQYDAFGNQREINDNDINPFRYCGEYYEKETEEIYLRNRYYDSRTGRFNSEDPIGSGLNWYAYCGNNPIKHIDPSGTVHLECSDNNPQTAHWTGKEYVFSDGTSWKPSSSSSSNPGTLNIDGPPNYRYVDIPQDGNLGTFMSYMGWHKITDTTSETYRLKKYAEMNGDYAISAPEYYGLINGRITVATLRNIGGQLELKTGDYIDVLYQYDDGTQIVFQCIVVGAKDPSDANCNIWGYNDGANIVEIMYKDYTPSDGYNAIMNDPWGSGRVVRITVVGSYDNGWELL